MKFCSPKCYTDSRRKGGSISSQGYRVQSINGKPILEHRLVMERIIGRPLLSTEVVHHRDGQRAHNEPSNLELWYRGQPAGQRVAELIDYVARFHREAVLRAIADFTPPPLA